MPKANTNTVDASIMKRAAGSSRLLLGASLTSLALASAFATPAHAQIVITDNTPVDNPGGQTVTSADGVTQTVSSGDNIELENDTNDGTVITLNGRHVNTDGDDEDVVIFVDNSEDNVVINIGSTGILRGLDGVIFYEGDGAVITNDGLIEGTGEATEAVLYFDRDSDSVVNSVTNNGTITSVGGATIGVDSLLGRDPSSGTVGDEDGLARFTLVNTGTISNTGTDSDADAIHFNGDPGNTGGENRGCLEAARINCAFEVDITNSGTISASRNNSSNAAIRSESDAVLRGTITNEAGGMITGASNAIRINGAHADHSVTITNAGTIDGQAEAGILIGGTGVTVDNQAGGMIIGDDEGIRIDGDSISIRGFGGGDTAADTVPANTSITNSGTISGTADGILTASDTLGVTITNNATGSIMGEEGVDLATGGTVTNNGTITGSAGDAINIAGTQDATVTLGADSTTSGTDDAVQFAGTGTNTLTVNSGASITGDLQANTDAASTNILNLAGTDATFNNIRAFDFDEVNVDGGVFALSSFATGNGVINLNSGTLLINSGLTGAITVGSAGVLGGNGTGGATTVADGGVINPGNLGAADQLSLTSLALSSGSILAFDLGDPNDASTSDRLNVAGDLTLDGTLNATDTGQFGIGVYRLIDYGGSLTDNILDVGTLPTGFDLSQAEIQTSVTGQVNLVISAATVIPSILFFDGAGTADDGEIAGGAGSWNLTDTNWGNSAGDENFAWNSEFAVFQGAAGTVTVDDAIAVTGIQFATDGYEIADGTGDLSITEAASNVRVDDGVTATISTAIGGAGGLNKIDTGTLVLSGINTYTGGTTIGGGTLVLDGTIAGATSIANGATLSGTGTATGAVTSADGSIITPGGEGVVGTLNTGDLVLSSGSILNYDLDAPGTGDLINVTGDLTLDGTLNANNVGAFGIGVYRLIDYTGGLTDNTLDLGTLPDGFDSNGVAVQTSVANQVNLVVSNAIPTIPDIQFWDGAAGTADGSIVGGDGSWNLTDAVWTNADGSENAAWNNLFAVFQGTAGTVTVDDAITFTGLQFVTDGYEIAAGTGAITITEALTNVRVDPGATATISAAIGGTGGLNKLDSGILILNGDHSFTGDSIVAGGELVVNGTIASAVSVELGALLSGSGQVGGLTINGNIAPGNSIGTLNIGGDVTFAATSSYDVEISADGTSDLIVATGAAIIEGGVVNVLADGTNFGISTDYTIITADSVTGTFDSVNSNLAFLTPTLSYTDDEVLLNVVRNNLAFAAIGTNSNQIGVGAAVESQGNSTLANAVVNLDAASAQSAFQQLSGEIHASTRTAMVENSRLVRNGVLDRLTDKGSEGTMLWGNLWTQSGDTDGTQSATGLSRDNTGLIAGMDFTFGESAMIGIATSYNDADLRLDNSNDRSDITTISALAYFGVNFSGFNLRAGGGYGWSDIETKRSVVVGAFSDSPNAFYDGNVAQGFAELGYSIEMGEGSIEPYAGIAVVRIETDEFIELGGEASIVAEDASDTSTIATAGIRFDMPAGDAFTIRGKAGWQHAFGTLTPTTDASFFTGSGFAIAGTRQSGDAGFVQLEAAFKVAENTTIGVSYDGIIGDETQDHAAMARITLGF